MNILYTVNDGFIPQVATSICSVCENNRHFKRIAIYLIAQGVTAENKEKLRAFVEGEYHREIYFIDLGEISSYVSFPLDTKGWSDIVVARLLLDRLLPDEVEKVLYLDGDTVVIDSLEDLWEKGLGDDDLIGMCPEPTMDQGRQEKLGLSSYLYCNSGVLLINLKKWRKQEISQKVFAYYREYREHILGLDQDALNGALRDDIKILSPRYNFFNIYFFYPYRVLKTLAKRVGASFLSKEEYQQAVDSPAIIHYLGEERPWREGNTHQLRHYYLDYLHKTPWKDTPMEKGWRVYFLCFKSFNLCMSFFPMLRYRIINALIPSFINLRKKRK